MRVLFFGYHAIGAACLRVLLEPDAGAEVAALVTHEDDSNEEIWFERPAPPARAAGVEVLTPSKEELRSDAFLARVRALAPEVILSCYYRHMIPVKVLEAAPRGGINLHGSYLPEYRGRCPVNWQILHGAERGGVTLHRMVKAPDAGDVLAQRAVPIAPRETAQSLYLKLIPAAEALFRATWPRIARGDLAGSPQDPSKATYFGGRRPGDGRIDWPAGAQAIDRLVRAVTHPYPGAFTTFENRKLFIWEAEPLEVDARERAGRVVLDGGRLVVHDGAGGALLIKRLGLEGEDEAGAADFARRHPRIGGARLGDPS